MSGNSRALEWIAQRSCGIPLLVEIQTSLDMILNSRSSFEVSPALSRGFTRLSPEVLYSQFYSMTQRITVVSERGSQAYPKMEERKRAESTDLSKGN